MERLFIVLLLTITILATSSMVFAQGMMRSIGSPQVGTQSSVSSDGHTAREEAEGKEIWEKLQTKQLECQTMTGEDFGALGEYFMGLMTGSSHEAMNNMMERMMGKQGEEQMHVVMGKRLSGCNTTAEFPTSGTGFMPMMNMMMGMGGVEGMGIMKGGGYPMMGGYGWGNMMNSWGGFGIGWISIILIWVLLILAIIALLRWLLSESKGKSSKTPLEILQERYARGEIEKKEYEEKVKILSNI